MIYDIYRYIYIYDEPPPKVDGSLFKQNNLVCFFSFTCGSKIKKP